MKTDIPVLTETPGGGTPTASPVLTLGALALPMLLASLGVSIANVALPDLARAFAVPFARVQWVVLAYLLAVTVTVVLAGRLGDRFGHRRLLLAGLALFSAASLLAGLAPSFGLLVAARTLQGAGGAVLMALTVALVRETVAPGRTGTAMGLLGTMSAIGTALGPSLGGLLLAGPGWRWLFLAMAPLGAAAFLFAARTLPASTGKPAVRGFDITGVVLLGMALGAYALAMTGAGGDLPRPALLAGAVVAFALFLLAERRAAFPLVPPGALRERGLAAALGVNAVVAAVMMATLVVGPFHLSRALGLDAVWVGLVMSVGPGISILGGVPSGRLVDRFGAGRIMLAGLVLLTTGALALALVPVAAGVAGYVAAILVLTPGYQLFQAANNTAVMADVPADRRGIVSGLLGLSRNLGLVTGAAVLGALFAWASGSADVATAAPDAVAHGLDVTFGTAAALLAVSFGVMARRR